MNTAKHTPGPWWIASVPNLSGNDYHIGSPNYRIASIAERQPGESQAMADMRRANAQLIAAAPDLFRTIQIAFAMLNRPDTERDENRVKAMLETVILKVEGRG